MLSEHPGGEVPGILRIVGVTDDHLSCSVGSALLKVISIRDLVIGMTRAARLLGTVRNFAIDREQVPIEASHRDLFMLGDLRGKGGRKNQKKDK